MNSSTACVASWLRVGDVGAPFASTAAGRSSLYSLRRRWWMASLDGGARGSRRVGAPVVRHRCGVSIHFAAVEWIYSCATCWRTRSATTFCNQTVARYPRVARTADEEAVADLHRAPHAASFL
jgi:hypothetical protein